MLPPCLSITAQRCLIEVRSWELDGPLKHIVDRATAIRDYCIHERVYKVCSSGSVGGTCLCNT